MLLLLGAFALVATTGATKSNFTVTDEAWFDIEVKDMDGPGPQYMGRFVIAIFGDTAPMTSLNFVSIAKGTKKGKGKLHYKGSWVHRVVPDFCIQMGDITVGDGTGGLSIYGKYFNDEQMILSHRSPGWVAMANHGPDTNGSQFYVMMTKARWLDDKHVVFGKVIRGFDVLKKIQEIPTHNTGVPKNQVKIVDSGVNELENKYVLADEHLDSELDLE